MIGYFENEPIQRLLHGLNGSLQLELIQLENDELPDTQILFLPEYHTLDEDVRPQDVNAMLVGINEVVYPDLERLPDGCFYYNGWPAPEAKTKALEIVASPATAALVRRILAPLGIQVIEAPGTPGMIAPRVVAMIINEAHLLLQEGAASAADIDTSMKLGTGYPLGAFAWEALWGVEKTRALLGAMAEREPEVVIPYWTIAPTPISTGQ